MSHSLVVVVFHNDHLLFTGFMTLICFFPFFITPLSFFPIIRLFAFPPLLYDSIYFLHKSKIEQK